MDHKTVTKTLAIIMGGGVGSRLFPLTKDRSKPAVPLGGKYRLVDIPISNCLNSGLRQIYILTQFNSTSLHRHINLSYKFDHFTDSFVEILAAQQTSDNNNWYQGTADAVRKNMSYFLERPYDYYIILSGDQLYRMDYRDLLAQHLETSSDITIATIPVQRSHAEGLGIMHTDSERKIIQFVEKPKDSKLLDGLRIPSPLLRELGKNEREDLYLASMGIYIFNRKILEDCLSNDLTDFGKHIIPDAINKRRVSSYIFEGYWEDIGTIRSFYDANLAMTRQNPPFNFFGSNGLVYTSPRFLPASTIHSASIYNAIISDGCVISDSHIENSIIGIRSIINSGTTIRNSIIMGADALSNELTGGVEHAGPIGIGRNSVVERAIIDKNAWIGEGVVITPEGKPDHYDGDNYYIRDGIVVVPKNAVIPNGTWI